MVTIDALAVVRAYAIFTAWAFAWECPEGHSDCGHVEYDVERRERLKALMIALYNSTIARLDREPLMSEVEDENLNGILVYLEQMGHAPATAELDRLT